MVLSISHCGEECRLCWGSCIGSESASLRHLDLSLQDSVLADHMNWSLRLWHPHYFPLVSFYWYFVVAVAMNLGRQPELANHMKSAGWGVGLARSAWCRWSYWCCRCCLSSWAGRERIATHYRRWICTGGFLFPASSQAWTRFRFSSWEFAQPTCWSFRSDTSIRRQSSKWKLCWLDLAWAARAALATAAAANAHRFALDLTCSHDVHRQRCCCNLTLN